MRIRDLSILPDLRTRRSVLASVGALSCGAAVAALWHSGLAGSSSNLAEDQLSADLSEMLMLGFIGSSTKSPFAHILASHIAEGWVGSVFFVQANVGSREDVAGLIELFKLRARSPLLLAIDHEGGAVQRLVERHSFTLLPGAHAVAASLSPDAAETLYAKAAAELSDLGFNLNLAPVVDLHDPRNPPVGQIGRAFSDDPAIVASYARALIDGMRSGRVLSALKHFPGHGHSLGDSHQSLPDITTTWSESELEPYRTLIAEGRAEAVLGGHLRLATLETSGCPTTMSVPVTTGLLRDRLGFEGVAITDDLDMAAIRKTMSRKEAVIRAIAAGNDILMIKNVFDFDPDLPRNIRAWVHEAIDGKVLHGEQIAAAARRVRRFKQRLAPPAMGSASVG